MRRVESSKPRVWVGGGSGGGLTRGPCCWIVSLLTTFSASLSWSDSLFRLLVMVKAVTEFLNQVQVSPGVFCLVSTVVAHSLLVGLSMVDTSPLVLLMSSTGDTRTLTCNPTPRCPYSQQAWADSDLDLGVGVGSHALYIGGVSGGLVRDVTDSPGVDLDGRWCPGDLFVGGGFDCGLGVDKADVFGSFGGTLMVASAVGGAEVIVHSTA